MIKQPPNLEKKISSWTFDKAVALGVDIIDNRANAIKCYKPEYTLVEKLQTISTKYRVNMGQSSQSPVNFIRHYYDVYCLLKAPEVRSFVGTNEYDKFKKEKFGNLDELDLSVNQAFNLSDEELETFNRWYLEKSDIYFKAPPSFKDIMGFISELLDIM